MVPWTGTARLLVGWPPHLGRRCHLGSLPKRILGVSETMCLLDVPDDSRPRHEPLASSSSSSSVPRVSLAHPDPVSPYPPLTVAASICCRLAGWRTGPTIGRFRRLVGGAGAARGAAAKNRGMKCFRSLFSRGGQRTFAGQPGRLAPFPGTKLVFWQRTACARWP